MPTPSPIMIIAGRVAIGLSILTLLAAWFAAASGMAVLGLSQQHLFSDAIALGVLGVAFLLDAIIHGLEWRRRQDQDERTTRIS